jgi:magnesium-transporting ATPase (P-type)
MCVSETPFYSAKFHRRCEINRHGVTNFSKSFYVSLSLYITTQSFSLTLWLVEGRHLISNNGVSLSIRSTMTSNDYFANENHTLAERGFFSESTSNETSTYFLVHWSTTLLLSFLSFFLIKSPFLLIYSKYFFFFSFFFLILLLFFFFFFFFHFNGGLIQISKVWTHDSSPVKSEVKYNK